MDRLEHYLDRVCRGTGGPRSLRQHLRQERMGAAASALMTLRDQPQVDELRAKLKSASEWLREARHAIGEKDAERLKAALQKFRGVYGQGWGTAAR